VLKKCASCKANKNISEFGKDKCSKDSLTHSCLECKNSAARNKRAYKKGLEISRDQILIFNKKCSVCDIIKESKCFSIDKYSRDNLTYQCNSCRTKTSKVTKRGYKEVNSSLTNEEIRAKAKDSICFSCGILKQGLEYTVDRSTYTGLGVYCLECTRVKTLKYDTKNRKSRRKKNNARQALMRNIPEFRYKEYKKGADQRNLSFSITIDEFITFWGKPCHYCGDKILSIGLDRVDNNLGYELSNIKACCFPCNQMKSNKNLDEWIDRMKKIIKNIGDE